MADKLVIEADVTRANQALGKLDESVKRVDSSARQLAGDMSKAEAAASRMSDAPVSGLSKTTTSVGGLDKALGALTGGFGKATAAVGALVAAVMAADAAMEKAFTQRTIMANLPYQIDQARDSALGLVGDMELARLAVSANRFEVAKTSEQFAQLAEVGTKLGLSVGKDATSSIEDLTVALSRGSPLILDNLGITLKVSEAHRIWAEAHHTTVAAMTEEQKALAFREVGLQKAIEAAERVTLSLTEQEKAWVSARQQWDELARQALPALTSSLGELWMTVDGGGDIAEDVLPLLKAYLGGILQGLKPLVMYIGFFAKQLAVVGRVASEIGDVFGFLSDEVGDAGDELEYQLEWLGGDAWNEVKYQINWLTEEGLLSQLGKSFEDQVPAVKYLTDSIDILRHAILDIPASASLMGPVADAIKLVNKEKERKEQIEERAEAQRAREAEGLALIEKHLQKQADAAEHAVKLAEAQGKTNAEMKDLYAEQLRTKLALLWATGEQAKAEQAIRDEEIRKVTAAAKSKGGKGPTDADRMRATGEIQIKQWQDRLALLEAEASLMFEDAVEYGDMRYKIAVEELRLEQQVLEVTKAKNSVERERNAARIEAIGREIQILDLEKQREDQAKAIELAQGASTERIAAMDREIERNKALGAATQLLERQRAEAYRQHVGTFGTTEELRQTEHEQELGRIEREREQRVKLAKEKLAEFEREVEAAKARGQFVEDEASRRLSLQEQLSAAEGNLDSQRQLAHEREMARMQDQAAARERLVAQINEGLSTFEGFQQQASSMYGFLAERNAAEQDAQLQRTVSTLEAQGAAQKAALDKQIAAAKGNAALQERLRKQQAAREVAIARQIEQAQAEHADRQKRTQMRAAGIEMLITGALETVKAVAAFAGFNFVEGALHTAAAAVAFVQGGMLMSGNIPGGGEVASMGGGGGAAGAGGGSSFSGAGGSSSTGSGELPETPASAEELTRLRGGYGSSPTKSSEAQAGTVVNISNSTIVSSDTGSMLSDITDRQTAKRYGT